MVRVIEVMGMAKVVVGAEVVEVGVVAVRVVRVVEGSDYSWTNFR